MLDLFYTKNEEGKIAQNLVFEYCDDNLEDVIKKNKQAHTSLPIDIVRDYLE
jgi:hypothetical protein